MKLNHFDFHWKGFLTLIVMILFFFPSPILLFVLLTVYLTLFFHESGHALAAFRSNIEIEEVSVGLGPKVVTHQFNDSVLHFRSLPFGGYNILEDDTDLKTTYKQKMLIASGGIIANFIAAGFAWVSFFIMWTLGSSADESILDAVVLNLESVGATASLSVIDLEQMVLMAFLFLGGINFGFAILQFLPLFFFDGAKIIQYTINHIVSKRKQEYWTIETHFLGKVWAGTSISVMVLWLILRYVWNI